VANDVRGGKDGDWSVVQWLGRVDRLLSLSPLEIVILAKADPFGLFVRYVEVQPAYAWIPLRGMTLCRGENWRRTQ